MPAEIVISKRSELQEEIWKPIAGYEGLYEASSIGRVRAMFNSWNGQFKPGRILKLALANNGYLSVFLYRPGKNVKAKR